MVEMTRWMYTYPDMTTNKTVEEVSIERYGGFLTEHAWPSLGSGPSGYFLISNPSNSPRTLQIVGLEVFGGADGLIEIFGDVTVNTAGTTVIPANVNLGSSTPVYAHCEYDGTYDTSSAVVYPPYVLPGGSGRQRVGFGGNINGNFIIPPGHNLPIKVTNKSANTEQFSIAISFIEH